MTMTNDTCVGPRLLFRVEPIPLESARGYLCRVASAHGYDSPQWLVRLAGFSGLEAALDREDRVRHIAHLLRLEPEEWVGMCYRNIKGAGGFNQRSFYGKPVDAGQLNLSRPPRMSRLSARTLGLVGDLGSLFGSRLSHPSLPSRCPVPQLQKDAGLAAFSRAPMPLCAASGRRGRGGGLGTSGGPPKNGLHHSGGASRWWTA